MLGLMTEVFMKEILIIMIYTAMEPMCGWIKENMKVNGIEIKCMVKEKLLGLMVKYMKEYYLIILINKVI